MTEPCGDLEQCIRSAATLAIGRCAQGLLTIDAVSEQVREEWEAQPHKDRAENQPTQQLLNSMALRYCSGTLYQACCSPLEETRNCAFANLRHYLAQKLQHSPYASPLIQYEGAAEDVLQMALEIVQKACMQHPPDGPDDPAAFLKWTITILYRQAYALVTKALQEPATSLDAWYEVYTDQLENPRNYDPEAHFDSQELHQTLENAILSLSNKRY